MYEEYLEDYVYKLMAKIASKICKLFKKKQPTEEKSSPLQSNLDNELNKDHDEKESNENVKTNEESIENSDDSKVILRSGEYKKEPRNDIEDDKVDEDLSNINFHMMLFFMWMCVTLVNIPALLTWARNFKYSMVLKPDTSYHTGMLLSGCSGVIWQMDGPRKNLKYYEAVTSLFFTMAVFIIALGPFTLSIINYGVAFMFTVITIQQLLDCEEKDEINSTQGDEAVATTEIKDTNTKDDAIESSDKEPKINEEVSHSSSCNDNQSQNTDEKTEDESLIDNCDVCSENRIYRMFKHLRDKFSFSND